MSVLPPFLEPSGDLSYDDLPYKTSVFKHDDDNLGSVHAHWWPCRHVDSPPQTVFIMIPGNPALVGFYTPFLSAIHEKDESGKLAILCHSYIGHTAGLDNPNGFAYPARYGLHFQVQNAIKIFDVMRAHFSDENTNIILAGHSIGAWIALQVLKARPAAVARVFLLFPTIVGIADTPNGRRLSRFFRPPLPRFASFFGHILKFVPLRIMQMFFPSWPIAQVRTIQPLLHSPPTIFAALTLAHDEMMNVRDLDTEALNEHGHRISIYFAERDDWVDKQREVILQSFGTDPGAVRIVHGERDIPHAFCINHGEELAAQCHEWLKS